MKFSITVVIPMPLSWRHRRFLSSNILRRTGNVSTLDAFAGCGPIGINWKCLTYPATFMQRLLLDGLNTKIIAAVEVLLALVALAHRRTHRLYAL